MAKKAPERTCTGCGTKKPKGQLVRLAVAEDGQVVVDRAQRAKGRGAYLCSAGCLKAALKRKAFGRAFRGKAVPFDEARLVEALTPGLQGPQIGLDAATRRSGAAREG